MKMLNEAAVRQYRRQGYYAPIPVMPRAEADALRGRLEAFKADVGVLSGPLRHKSHLLFTWLHDLVRRTAGGPDHATLVRGENLYGHFDGKNVRLPACRRAPLRIMRR